MLFQIFTLKLFALTGRMFPWAADILRFSKTFAEFWFAGLTLPKCCKNKWLRQRTLKGAGLKQNLLSSAWVVLRSSTLFSADIDNSRLKNNQRTSASWTKFTLRTVIISIMRSYRETLTLCKINWIRDAKRAHSSSIRPWGWGHMIDSRWRVVRNPLKNPRMYQTRGRALEDK